MNTVEREALIQAAPRLVDGGEYHNAASHQTSEGLRERFAKIDPNWNRKPQPKPAGVTPIRRKQ